LDLCFLVVIAVEKGSGKGEIVVVACLVFARVVVRVQNCSWIIDTR
jgi:hypothetical protein